MYEEQRSQLAAMLRIRRWQTVPPPTSATGSNRCTWAGNARCQRHPLTAAFPLRIPAKSLHLSALNRPGYSKHCQPSCRHRGHGDLTLTSLSRRRRELTAQT